jgi:hypothetical protein
MDLMGCPYYKDYTRMCIQFFPQVIQHSGFSVCESDKYQSCLAYHILQKDFKCKYLNRCLEIISQDLPWIFKFFIEDEKFQNFYREVIDKYCSSEQNHVLCSNYKLLEQGIKPPLELLPDGKKLRIRDIVFKKEITIE